jgi:hypothetical protein
MMAHPLEYVERKGQETSRQSAGFFTCHRSRSQYSENSTDLASWLGEFIREEDNLSRYRIIARFESFRRCSSIARLNWPLLEKAHKPVSRRDRARQFPKANAVKAFTPHSQKSANLSERCESRGRRRTEDHAVVADTDSLFITENLVVLF